MLVKQRFYYRARDSAQGDVLAKKIVMSPDQKAVRLVRLLTEEVIALFGVPEALLSDRGTNLMSHLMVDICKN